jgi:hypothetical protein
MAISIFSEYVVSELQATNPEVPGSMPGITRFSER